MLSSAKLVALQRSAAVSRRLVMNSPQTHLEQTAHLSPHHHHHHHHHHCRHHRHHHHHHLRSHSCHHHHHHHHHHRHVRRQCALHNQISHQPNFTFCPNLINPPLQNTQHAASAPSQYEAPHSSHQTQTLQDDDGLEELDDEEPVFVMTDEWREFFAKSEARRREAKKLAKQQGKK